MNELFFARPSVSYPGGLPAALVELGVVQLPDDGGSGLNDHLLGQPLFLEAFPTREARDERLGPVNDYVAFIATDWVDDEVEQGRYDHSHVAIGPALGMEGFDAIADQIIPGRVATLHESAFGGFSASAQIIIGRVTYQVDISRSGVIQVMGAPLYHSDIDDPTIHLTLHYLSKAFEGRH